MVQEKERWSSPPLEPHQTAEPTGDKCPIYAVLERLHRIKIKKILGGRISRFLTHRWSIYEKTAM